MAPTADLVSALEITSAVVSFISCPIFVAAIIRTRDDPHGIRPHRFTWAVLTTMNAILVAALSAGHQDIRFQASYLAGSSIVFGFSLWRGTPGSTLFDRICLVTCAVTLVAWRLSGDATLAYFLGLTTNLFGTLPTLAKGWHKPWTEPFLPWLIVTIGSFIELAASLIGHKTGTGLANAIYFTLINGAIVSLVGPWRRKRASVSVS